MRTRHLTALGPLLLVAACTAPSARLLVVVNSDYAVPGELGSIAVRACSGDDDACPEQLEFTVVGAGATPRAATFQLPLSFAVVPRDNDARRTALVELEPRDGAGAPLGVRRVRVGFVAGETVVVPVFLSRACAEASPCGARETCRGPGALRCVTDAVAREELTPLAPNAPPGSELDVVVAPPDALDSLDALDALDRVDALDASVPDAEAAAPPADARLDAPTATLDARDAPALDARDDGPDAAPVDARDATLDARDATPDAPVDAPPSDACTLLCGATCVDLLTSTTHCGRCNAPCAATANAEPRCVAGMCAAPACLPGFYDCDGNPTNGCEVDGRANPQRCGGCTTSCPGSSVGGGLGLCRYESGTSRCVVGCPARLVWNAGECVPGPQLRSPLSGSVVHGSNARLRFFGVTGRPTRIELCAGAPGCASPMVLTPGTSGSIDTADLAPGAWFWRVQLEVPSPKPTTPWWAFFQQRTLTPLRPGRVWGERLDLNRDGLGDAVVLANALATSSGGVSSDRLLVFLGGAAGAPAAPAQELFVSRTCGNFGARSNGAGDVDGDGFVDLVANCNDRLLLFRGGPAGVEAAPSSFAALPVDAEGGLFEALRVAGDVNDDGYADVFVAVNPERRLRVYLGGPAGLDSLRYFELTGPVRSPLDLGARLAPAFDADGDGFVDLAATLGEFGERGWLSSGAPVDASTAPRALDVGPAADPEDHTSRMDVGDVNGDGLADLLLGRHDYGFTRGRILTLLGSTAALPLTTLGPTLEGPTTLTEPRLGIAFVGNVDLDGDGATDLVATLDTPKLLYVYRGGAGGFTTPPRSASLADVPPGGVPLGVVEGLGGVGATRVLVPYSADVDEVLLYQYDRAAQTITRTTTRWRAPEGPGLPAYALGTTLVY